MKESAYQAVIVSILFFPIGVMAESDVSFAASTAINFKTGEYIPEDDPDTRFDIHPTTLDIIFTVISDRFFTSVNYDSTLKDDYTVTNGGTIENVGSRLDYGVTVGYQVIEGLNIFSGYKVGETEGKSVRTTGTTSKDITFRDTGLFIGVNYGWHIRDVFSLSVNAAYASLDGEVRIVDNIAGSVSSTNGETTGLSYGFKMTKEMREGTQIAIGYKQRKYTFKDEDIGFGSAFNLDQNFETVFVEYTSFFE